MPDSSITDETFLLNPKNRLSLRDKKVITMNLWLNIFCIIPSCTNGFLLSFFPDEKPHHAAFHLGLHCLGKHNWEPAPDEMPHYAAFHLGLHCLGKTRLGVKSILRVY